MSNIYKTDFLSYSSKLDAMVNAGGQISTYAALIVDTNDDLATVALLSKITELNKNRSMPAELKNVSAMVKNSLLKYYGTIRINDICKQEEPTETAYVNIKTLDDLKAELNAMIGLKKVKDEVENLIAYQKVQKLREEINLQTSKSTLHLAFTGKPGTGKTTVARIIGQIYKKLGILSKGHFIEVSRTDLIAGYQGQTAMKVREVVEQAKGGILFIDEAYSITENEQSDSYGRECLTELTKALEDYRDDLVVIVAGYTEPMNQFFDSNPGLKSRFNTFIEFDDYSVDELKEIFINICDKNDYTLDKETLDNVAVKLIRAAIKKDDSFSNGRFVRNIYDKMVIAHARRVSEISNPSIDDLKSFTKADFEKV